MTNSTIDRIRVESSLAGGEFGVALCALIYLRWADFQEAEQEAIAAFEETDYKTTLPGRLHWRSYCDASPERLHSLFAQELPAVLEGLGNERHNPLATQLHRIAPGIAKLGQLPCPALERLTAWLADQPFETQNDRRKLLEALDAFLQRSRDKSAGQHFTPLPLARLLVELAAPSAGDRVYDPCFGSASLLTGSLDYVQQHAADRAARTGEPLLHIAGLEISPNAYTIGITRLALAGISDPQVELGNSLERPPWNNPQRDGFDVALVNPPWGVKVDGGGLGHFAVRTTDSTSLFIQHVLDQLRPGGRAAIVVPVSVLSGANRFKLRQLLIEQHTIEAVISLAPELVLPAATLETGILLIHRGGSTKTIRMVNAATELADQSWRTRHLSEAERITRIAGIVRAIPLVGSAWDVDVRQLADLGWDLTPKRRDLNNLEQILGELAPKLDIHSLKACCGVTSGRHIPGKYLQDTPPRSNIEPSGRTLFAEIERAEIIPQRTLPFADYPIPYVRIRDVQQGVVGGASCWLGPVAASRLASKWKLRAGDVLVAKSGAVGRAGIVRNGAVGAVAAAGFFILRADADTIDAHYLLAYLQSAACKAWLEDHASGSSVRHLSANVLKELPLPVPPLPIQLVAAEQYRKFGTDVLAYLAELLSEQYDAPIAGAINDWVMWLSCTLKLEQFQQAVEARSLATLLASLEEIADGPCPVNHCRQCGQPYHLDFSSHYLDPPYEYGKGIAETCLSCWLGVGASHETLESLSKQSPLVPWAFAFREALSRLSGVSGIPDSVGLLKVLDDTRLKLTSALEAIAGHLPNEATARRVTQGLRSLIEGVSRSLFNDIRISVDVLHAVELEDGLTDLALRVTNRGTLPLRKVSFTTEPKLKRISASIPYMAAGTPYTIAFAGRLPSTEGVASLSLDWTGTDLRGDVVAESGELAITPVPPCSPTKSAETALGSSPYITGNPVRADRGDVFFGREELLGQIRQQIGTTGNVVLLEGNRRTGKTSILWHLEGPDRVPGWLGVYCSFQGTEGDNAQASRGVPTAEIFRGIATDVAKSIQKHLGSVVLPDGSLLAKGRLGIADAVRPAIRDEAPFTYFREYLEMLLEPLGEARLGLLLLLDEFDKLQEGIVRGVTSPQVPENIRFLLQSYQGLSAVLTGTKRMKRMREEYFSVLYGLGTACDVSSLSREAASRLVTEPVRGQLAYAAEAVERAVFLTAGQPYLLQCLCDTIFRMAKETGFRSINKSHVDEAAEALIRDNGHFVDLFRYAGSDRRRLILALCHRGSEGPDALRIGIVQEKLTGLGIEVRDEQLAADLEWLTDFELLSFSGIAGRDAYSLAVPLMGTWINTRDFAALVSKARAETEDHTNV